mmetsp:Transcript_25494/g.85327  ORF Transcript_25494/g.85327 Transcript_25494/m.85327 type:complete len:266 (-) Transcript_25494:73-870(-)
MQQSNGRPATDQASVGRLQKSLHGSCFGVLAVVAGSLQGCSLDIPRHSVGNWQAQENYLEQYKVSPPGSHQGPILNSCTDIGLDPSLLCTGHGRCKDWFDPLPLDSKRPAPLGPSFCECDRDWTGPECDIQRKSQFTAFVLSMFFGMFGADMFYLGWFGLGVAKLCTLGGLGVWWIFDVARIGSSPVSTVDSFRVAADVEHWAFVLCFLSFTAVLAFGLSIWSINREQVKKAREILILRTESQVSAVSYGSMMSSWGQQPLMKQP